MEILETIVEMPEGEIVMPFKSPISGVQHPLIAVIRSQERSNYKLVLVFITSIHDACNCKLETEINVLINFKYTGPPLQPSDLFVLFYMGSIAAKKKIGENKIFQFGTPAINWQALPVQVLEKKLQTAIEKMNTKSN